MRCWLLHPFTGSLATQTFLYRVLTNGVCSHERQVIMNNSHALCGWGSDGPDGPAALYAQVVGVAKACIENVCILVPL